jgi:hypothetical protein
MPKEGAPAGRPKAQRRFHVLRHAIAGQLRDAGADIACVPDRLGQATIPNTIIALRAPTAPREAHTRPLFASPHVV